ncbi:MAG TPA: TolC family protein [Gemmatimonadaceae bacterium]|nr:TolC family protein [Gemmatimonadaceae bacterium]
MSPRRSFLVLAALSAAALDAHAQARDIRSGPQPDTLRMAIEEAVARAVRLSDESRLAAAQLDVTEAQITTARAAGLPQLRLNGAYTQVIENARANVVGSVFAQAFTYNTNANLSQTLFQGGRIFAGTRAAADARRAARFEQTEVRAQVAVDIQRAYFQALLSDRLYEIQVRNLALAEERLKQVERLEAGGRAARYDVLRARVERTNLEPALIQARSDRELTLLEVKRIVNIPIQQPLVLTSALDPDGLQAFVATVANDSSADPVRATVRSAESIVEARGEGVKVARADLLPSVSAFFQTGYLALPSNNGVPTVWGQASNSLCPTGAPATRICQNNGWFPDRNFGLQISWPIFDGLRAKGNIDLAQAQKKVAEVQLSQERELVQVERARARAEFARARSGYDAQRDNAREAEEAYRLAALRFERGLDTQLDASAVQLQLLIAQSNEARSIFDLYIAAADLARARGLPVPMPPTRPAPAAPSR